jgi:hypothetical protein
MGMILQAWCGFFEWWCSLEWGCTRFITFVSLSGFSLWFAIGNSNFKTQRPSISLSQGSYYISSRILKTDFVLSETLTTLPKEFSLLPKLFVADEDWLWQKWSHVHTLLVLQCWFLVKRLSVPLLTVCAENKAIFIVSLLHFNLFFWDIDNFL